MALMNQSSVDVFYKVLFDGQTSVPRQLPSLDSAKIDVDDQSVEPVEELEKKSEEFQKILKVSNEERDWVQRMQVVDRAAAAIAAARAILEDKNKELRTEAGDRGGSGGGSGGGGDGTIGARQEGAQIRSVVVPVPQSEISGTRTPGPDFWSWEPPQGSDKVSDDVIDLPTAMKTSQPFWSFVGQQSSTLRPWLVHIVTVDSQTFAGPKRHIQINVIVICNFTWANVTIGS
nr:uncharacterized protein LOC103453021 [Malus domestica]